MIFGLLNGRQCVAWDINFLTGQTVAAAVAAGITIRSEIRGSLNKLIASESGRGGRHIRLHRSIEAHIK